MVSIPCPFLNVRVDQLVECRNRSPNSGVWEIGLAAVFAEHEEGILLMDISTDRPVID
jgi:hypothetical protein